MRTFLPIAFAALRGVDLPFPDVKDPSQDDPGMAEAAAEMKQAAPEPSLPEAAASNVAVEPAQGEDVVVAPWTPPKAKEEDFASSSDAFAHPSAAVVKDWETAPKVEIFDTPTSEPTPEITSSPKKVEAALPIIHSSINPIVTTKQDDDPELASIQEENPLAYGIVKALLLKKSMGLPLPGSQIQAHATVQIADGADHAPSSSDHINNMFNWKPQASASDELAAAETMSSVSEVDAPVEEAPEPKAPVEVSAPEPVVHHVEEEVEAPVEAPVEAAAEKPAALGSWLGVASAPQEAAAAPQRSSGGMSSVMSSYMSDLS